MTLAAIELVVSLHNGECDCRDTTTARDFERAVKRAHPLAWEWHIDKHATDDDDNYISRRNRLGKPPKREPNPDAVPASRRRKLSKAEGTLLKSHKSRWHFVDQADTEDDPSIFSAFGHGSRLSLSQAAQLSMASDGWVRCSRPHDDRPPAERIDVQAHPAYAEIVNGEPVCHGCLDREMLNAAA